MSRERFEKWFPLKHLFDYVYFSEDQGNYVYHNYDEKHIEAYEYVNSAWSAWQEQQKVVDDLTAENQKLALANTKYFNGNKEYFLKLNALNKVLNHAIDGFYGHEHEGVCLNNLIYDLELAFNKESEP